MDFLNNAVNTAREAFDIAYKKTGELVDSQKQKFDIASLENKRNKSFEALGKLYFEFVKDENIENDEIKALVEEIKEKNEKIEKLKEEMNSIKNKVVCENCSALNDETALFCSTCGNKL